jgi:selenocysteine lyase/cysteine desulfurase
VVRLGLGHYNTAEEVNSALSLITDTLAQ